MCCGTASHLTPDKVTEIIRFCDKDLIQNMMFQ